MVTKTAKGALKALNLPRVKVSFKPYVQPYSRARQQLAFRPIKKNKIYFDANISIPTGLADKAKGHVKRHSRKYIWGGHGATSLAGGYYGVRLAQKRRRRR